MAGNSWTYRAVAEALFNQGVNPNDENYREELAKHIKQSFNFNDSQMNHSEVETFLNSFTKSVKGFWTKSKSRKNSFFSVKAHPNFWPRVVSFSEEVNAIEEPIANDEPMEVVQGNSDEESNVVQRIKSWSGKGRTQQWRDKRKTLESGTPNCILSAAAQTFYDKGQKDAGYVLKEIIKDPIGTGEKSNLFIVDQTETSKNFHF